MVDDAAQGVEQVVRGDDLASSAPRQRHLADLLGLPAVTYAHVALVLGPSGKRLAKRDGAVTLADLPHLSPADVLAGLSGSLGLGPCRTTEEALAAMPGDQRFFSGAVWSSGLQAPISSARRGCR